MELHRLFSSITIKNLTIKNRLIMPAIHHVYCTDGSVTEKFKEHYWRIAEGGVGMIIVGGCRIDDYGASFGMMSLQYDDNIKGWKEFVNGVHARGAKVAVQLYHAGRYSKQKNLPKGKTALAPSAVFAKYTRETPKEMTIEEIKEVIQKWAEAAVRAKKAGFDAVEIIGSAGYLISQFLSPITNLREDEYGGSWGKRCRFPLELITAVKAAVGNEYPIFMRISGNDFMEGSNTNVEASEFAKLIEKAGVDMIDVTGGWHETAIPQLPGEVPSAGYSYLAAGIKKVVSKPVMICNRINDPIIAEELLALGRGDLIGVGRALVADPDWPRKAKEGCFAEIRRCVACNQGCLAKTFFGEPMGCLVNSSVGREKYFRVKKATKPKRILVVGGGPAGCEFSIKAAELGHEVTLWEKSDCIGGQLALIAATFGKQEYTNFIKYFETMLRKYNIEVVVNKEATEEELLAGENDAIIVATGAIPNLLSSHDKVDHIMTVTANDVLAGKVIPGKNVVIVGGGAVGCETAQYLARKGSITQDQLYFLSIHQAETPEKIQSLLNSSDRNVAIIEIEKRIGGGFAPGTGWPVLADLNRLGVKKHTLSRISFYADDMVVIEKSTECGTETLEIPCDTIVLAIGSRSNDALYKAIKDKVPNVYNIGDSRTIGKALDAIRDADNLAIELSSGV